MKHKNILDITLLFITFLFSSCLKDRGNYTYTDHEEITIKGIEKEYTKISTQEKLTINPEVTSSKPNAEFEYSWGIYETNTKENDPTLDIIATSKNLDYLVIQPAQKWALIFKATNKKTGYSKYITSYVNVVTEFTRGWYVTKGINEETDLDLFLTPDNIIPTTKIENVYSLVNGKRLKGNPIMTTFFSDYKSNTLNSARFTNTRALFLTAENDAGVININTLREIRSFNSLFYSPPQHKKPLFCMNAYGGIFFNNNGGLHSILSMSDNTGQFGVKQMGDDKNKPYRLSKYFIGKPTYNFLFDEISKSFVSAMPLGDMLIKSVDVDNTEMPANNTNKNMLYFGCNGNFPPKVIGIAIMQDIADPSLKLLSFIAPSTNYGANLYINNDTLAVTDKLYNGEYFTVLEGDENLMYFTTGREVWTRNLSNSFEQLQYTVPEGETITYIRHRKYSEDEYAYNYIIIGTKIGNNYKVRMFQKISGNLNPQPDIVLEGTGTVGDVIYISPSVGTNTYLNSF